MASSSASTTSSRKRKRAVLSIEEKLKIIRKLGEGYSIVSIMAEFGIGKSTVYDIKASREKVHS